MLAMDKEIADKHYRIVGKLQALHEAATHAECMPCDKATRALLGSATKLLHDVVTSAWEYADERTAAGKPDMHPPRKSNE